MPHLVKFYNEHSRKMLSIRIKIITQMCYQLFTWCIKVLLKNMSEVNSIRWRHTVDNIKHHYF